MSQGPFRESRLTSTNLMKDLRNRSQRQPTSERPSEGVTTKLHNNFCLIKSSEIKINTQLCHFGAEQGCEPNGKGRGRELKFGPNQKTG